MPEKIAPLPRKPQKPPNAAPSKKADPITDKLLQHLAGTPALTAVELLANMLPDTEDPATRLAIMRTRIQVLRARTTACQLGKPVAGYTTLGEVFAKQASTEQQLSAHVADPSESDPEPNADTASDAKLAEATIKVRLLQTYIHEGIELPEGCEFQVSAQSATDLAERGVCEVLEDPETTDTSEDPENVK